MKPGIPIMSGLTAAALIAAGGDEIIRWFDAPAPKKRDPKLDAEAVKRAEEKRARRAAKRLKDKEAGL